MSIRTRIKRLEEQIESPTCFVLEMYGPGEPIEEREYPLGARVIRVQIVNKPRYGSEAQS